MEQKKLTIDDLLASLQDVTIHADKRPGLENNKDTWSLIGNGEFDKIAEKVGVDESEVNDYLREWVEDNPYKNI